MLQLTLTTSEFYNFLISKFNRLKNKRFIHNKWFSVFLRCQGLGLTPGMPGWRLSILPMLKRKKPDTNLTVITRMISAAGAGEGPHLEVRAGFLKGAA